MTGIPSDLSDLVSFQEQLRSREAQKSELLDVLNPNDKTLCRALRADVDHVKLAYVKRYIDMLVTAAQGDHSLSYNEYKAMRPQGALPLLRPLLRKMSCDDALAAARRLAALPRVPERFAAALKPLAAEIDREAMEAKKDAYERKPHGPRKQLTADEEKRRQVKPLDAAAKAALFKALTEPKTEARNVLEPLHAAFATKTTSLSPKEQVLLRALYELRGATREEAEQLVHLRVKFGLPVYYAIQADKAVGHLRMGWLSHEQGLEETLARSALAVGRLDFAALCRDRAWAKENHQPVPEAPEKPLLMKFLWAAYVHFHDRNDPAIPFPLRPDWLDTQ